MNVKFQVFVSSTYEDLKDERNEVIRAVLEMGHIPVGMEMFNAADEEQWEIITRHIDQSDYYVVVVAHRYGSKDGDISYTEKEHAAAIERGVPVLAFIIDDAAPWPVPRIDQLEADKHALARFKAKLRLRPVDSWRNKDELHWKCAIALGKAFASRPRPGWVRATSAPGPEVAEEMSRLSRENASLRAEVESLSQNDTSSYAQDADAVEITLQLRYPTKSGDNSPVKITTDWNSLFRVVAATALEDPTENSIARELRRFVLLQADHRPDGEHDWLLDDDFARIRIQFLALGLISVAHTHVTEEKSAIFGNGTRLSSELVSMWNLTLRGERHFASLSATRRQAAASATDGMPGAAGP